MFRRVAAFCAGCTCLLAADLSSLVAQETGTVSGRISRLDNAQPVAGALVLVRNSTRSAHTDSEGRFQIIGVKVGTYTVVVRHPEFVEQLQRNVKVSAGESAELSMGVTPAVLPIDEPRSGIGGEPSNVLRDPFSIGRLSGDQLQVPTGGSTIAALAGKLAGVTVLGASGQLAPGLSVTVRSQPSGGISSLLPPLIVVDGVLLPRGISDAELDLDPADIASIEVLKGPAAAAYGSRGLTGVIAMVTKGGERASPGQTRFEYRTEATHEPFAPLMPLGRNHQYRLNATGTAFISAAGNDTTWSGRTSDPRRIADQPYPGQLYDNVGAVISPASALRHHASLAHHGRNVSHALAFNRADHGAVLPNNNGLQRNQGRLSFDYRAGDRFSIGFDGSYTDAQFDAVAPGESPFRLAQLFSPGLDLTARVPDGHYVQQPDPGFGQNPLWNEETTFDDRSGVRRQASVHGRYHVSSWLVLDTHLGEHQVKQWTQWREYDPIADSPPPIETRIFERSAARNGTVGATAFNRFSDWSLWGRLGGGRAREEYEHATTDLRSRSLPRALERSALSTNYRDYQLELGVDYGDRYRVEAMAIHEKHDIWQPAQQWQTNYRAGASYLISRESWFHLPQVDDLAFHYAVGSLRGQPLRFSQPAPAGPIAGNPNLRPPKLLEHELGLTARLLDHRVSLEFAYARQVSEDQIHLVPAAPSTGLTGIMANVGAQLHQTLEATVQARVFNRPSLSLDVSATGSRTRNEVTRWNRTCFPSVAGYPLPGRAAR